jgi:hypothetical protein
METSEPLPTHREAKLLLLLTVGTVVGLLLVFYPRPNGPAAIRLAYAVPIILAAALVLALRVARAGAATAPRLPLLFGLAFIVGGATLDISATVIHSPDLKLEQNPIARVLLDSGHSLSFVYWYAGVCQPLFLACLAFLWVGLLRHRHSIENSVRGVQTFLQLVKAATGGSSLTWRQWLLPLKFSELPNAYHLLWFVAVGLLAGSIDRWYLGAQWFGFVPGNRLLVVSVAVVGALGFYFVCLWRAVRKAHGEPVVANPSGGHDGPQTWTPGPTRP